MFEGSHGLASLHDLVIDVMVAGAVKCNEGLQIFEMCSEVEV